MATFLVTILGLRENMVLRIVVKDLLSIKLATIPSLDRIGTLTSAANTVMGVERAILTKMSAIRVVELRENLGRATLPIQEQKTVIPEACTLHRLQGMLQRVSISLRGRIWSEIRLRRLRGREMIRIKLDSRRIPF
jgi:hypothetical protein